MTITANRRRVLLVAVALSGCVLSPGCVYFAYPTWGQFPPRYARTVRVLDATSRQPIKAEVRCYVTEHESWLPYTSRWELIGPNDEGKPARLKNLEDRSVPWHATETEPGAYGIEPRVLGGWRLLYWPLIYGRTYSYDHGTTLVIRSDGHMGMVLCAGNGLPPTNESCLSQDRRGASVTPTADGVVVALPPAAATTAPSPKP